MQLVNTTVCIARVSAQSVPGSAGQTLCRDARSSEWSTLERFHMTNPNHILLTLLTLWGLVPLPWCGLLRRMICCFGTFFDILFDFLTDFSFFWPLFHVFRFFNWNRQDPTDYSFGILPRPVLRFTFDYAGVVALHEDLLVTVSATLAVWPGRGYAFAAWGEVVAVVVNGVFARSFIFSRCIIQV